jgi:hypothetical protein
MIYVAGGPYYLGTGGTEQNAFYAYDDSGTRLPPYRVTGPGPIPTGRRPGKLWARGAGPEDGGEIPAAFPNGYGAFYCMKKHITPRNYAGFLATLTPAEFEARFYADSYVRRTGEPPDYTFTWHIGGARDGSGMRHISWEDGCSFAAWAGLRPMTELELEKAIRGPRLPFPDEVGPSYWKVHCIGGSAWDGIKSFETHSERAVTVGNARGRAFKGTHGGGSLGLPADWPQADAVGSGLRYNCSPNLAATRASDRLNAAAAITERGGQYKFRCVRTAPKEAAANGTRKQGDQP